MIDRNLEFLENTSILAQAAMGFDDSEIVVDSNVDIMAQHGQINQ